MTIWSRGPAGRRLSLALASWLAFGAAPLPALGIPRPRLTGDFSSYFGTRGSSRRTDQHPATTWRAALSSAVGLPFLTLGLNLLYTSDDRITSRRVNQLNLRPSWSWGSIDVGDFSPGFTAHTLSGRQVRGGGINLFPGQFRLSLVGGETARPDTATDTHRQMLYAVRLGVDALALNVVRASDDPGSLPASDSARPQENLVAGVSSDVRLFRSVDLSVEVDGSIHTRDLRSDTVAHDDLPRFIYGIYQPRTSSRVDYALKAGAKFDSRPLGLDLSVAQVGPGYTSLGVPYLRNDVRRAKVAVSTRSVPRTHLRLTLERDDDNLAGDKVATAVGTGIGVFLQSTPVVGLSVQAGFIRRTATKDAAGDSFDIDNLSSMLQGSASYTYRLWGMNQSSTVTVGEGRSADSAALSRVAASRTVSIGLRHTLTPARQFTVSLSASQSRSVLGRLTKSQGTYAVGVNQRILRDRMVNALTLSYASSSAGRNLRVSGSHGYALTARDRVSVDWSLSLLFSPEEDIFERQAGLSYRRSFF